MARKKATEVETVKPAATAKTASKETAVPIPGTAAYKAAVLRGEIKE